MRPTDSDIEWLESFFPNLLYDPKAQKLVGELSFCACYDKTSGKMNIELAGSDDVIRKSDSFLCDVFEIEILLDSESVGFNGWPKVHEVGGRYKSIAKKCCVRIIDLHFFSDSCSCCLGIRHSPERNLTIKRFLCDLVIPFFYRLSYTDRFGIEAARSNLWGEYAHGDEGLKEYEQKIFSLARHNHGRNDPCPCGSGKKYKKCCLDEIQAMNRVAQPKHQQTPIRQ